MKEYIIGKNEAGQRFDKYLLKLLNKAPSSFVYKMLRKKNIVLNDKKSDGREKLKLDDNVKIYLSDETFEKFSSVIDKKRIQKREVKLDILYEDDNILLINKPAGLLSQKADNDDDCINDRCIQYLINTECIDEISLKTFKPSICNRLDRNTSGIIAAGKSLEGLQKLSELFKNRTIHKYYICIVEGNVTNKKKVAGYLYKDRTSNKVTISSVKKNNDYTHIETEFAPIAGNQKYTLLCVSLITGKTHQIRAALSSLGFPLIGDTKYGNEKCNRYFRENYGLKHQFLHSYLLQFPVIEGGLSNLSNQSFIAPYSPEMEKIIQEEFGEINLPKKEWL